MRPLSCFALSLGNEPALATQKVSTLLIPPHSFIEPSLDDRLSLKGEIASVIHPKKFAKT